MNNVCGTCKHYNEWENGYCDKINAVVEPEEYQCKEYAEEYERNRNAKTESEQ